MKVGDVVYLKIYPAGFPANLKSLISDAYNKHWVFTVKDIKGERATLSWIHPAHKDAPSFVVNTDVLGEAYFPEVGETVTIIDNIYPDLYGDMSPHIGKVGVVTGFGDAKKSVVLQLEDGNKIKIHLANISPSFYPTQELVAINDINECSPTLIATKEQVQECMTFDIGNKYYDESWTDKSVLPRREMEKCYTLVTKSVNASNKCFSLAPPPFKEETKAHIDDINKRYSDLKKIFESQPRKECSGKQVVKFKDENDISKFLVQSDSQACIEAGGTWDIETAKCVGADAVAYSLNMITNRIHDLGLKMQKVKTKHCECKIPTPAVMTKYHESYCEGVAYSSTITSDGRIHHKLGVHSAVVSFGIQGDKTRISLDYQDSIGYKGSKARLHSIKTILEDKLNLKCKIISKEHNKMSCEGDLENPLQAKSLALFLSGTLDADLKTSDKSLMEKNLYKLWTISEEKSKNSGCVSKIPLSEYWGSE